MGKSKKKKNQFKDFQKVKLKVGKTLPKGLNETVATFKSRSIQVKEQLKVDHSESEPTTRRKLSLPDLLSQCQHYNTTVKHDALTGMKELLTGHPELAQRNLVLILERCSELFMDKDPVIRQTVQKVLRLVFTQVSSNQIAPFFPILSAHLCCAMTHISDDIQQDSLVVLDLCLENCPELVTASSNQIMSNFIEQISRQTQTSKSGSQGRSLLVNPSSKLSGQKWRNRVMERLQKFLRAMLQQLTHGHTQMARRVAKIHHFSTTEANNVQPFAVSSQSSDDWFNLKHFTQQAEVEKRLSIKTFTEVLVPLLLQCWIEAGPSQLATNLPGNCLSGEAMTTLWNVVSLLQLLLELLDKGFDAQSKANIEWFSEKYLKDLVQYFLPYFPYAMHEKPRHNKMGQGSKVKGQKEMQPQISVFTLNLSVCKVFCYFMEDSSTSSWQENFLQYLCEGFAGIRLTEEQLLLTVATVEKVVQCTQDEDTIDSLLTVTFNIFKACTDVVSKETKALLKFFGDFAFGGSVLAVKSIPVLSQWMASLPSLMWLLIESRPDTVDAEVAESLLHYLKSAGPLFDETFIRSLKVLLFERVFAITDDTLTRLPVDCQKKLVALVYWVPVREIDRSRYQRLAQFCRNSHLPHTVIQHLLELVTMKYKMAATTISDVDTAEFLSFMLSLLLGDVSTHKSNPSSSEKGSVWTPLINTDRLTEKQYQHRIELIKVVPEILRRSPDDSSLLNAVTQFIQTYLADGTNAKVNLLTAIGLLRLTSVLSNQQHMPASDSLSTEITLNSLTSDLFGSVLSHLIAIELTSNNSNSRNALINETVTELDGQQTLSTVATMKSADKLQEEREMDNVQTISPKQHKALWAMLVEVVSITPGLFQYYLRRLKDRIGQGDLEDILKFHIFGITRLLLCKQMKEIVQANKQFLHRLVTQLETTSSDLSNHKWWHQFKYEVSIL